MIMPTTVYKVCTTRPNLDSIFVFELYDKNDYLVQNDIGLGDEVSINLNDKISTVIFENECFSTPTKIIFYRYEEFISWFDIFQRRDALRPDLKYRIDQLGLFDLYDPEIYGYGPKFNFFSLTHTEKSEFETFEQWEYFYNFNRLAAEHRKNLVGICNNTVTEQIFVDGILINYTNFVF